MDDKILKSLETAINDMPSTSFARIAEASVEKMEEHDDITRQKKNNVVPLFVKVLSTAAVFVFVVTLWYSQFIMISSTVQIDVNPSIEFELNRWDKVVDVNGLTADGYKFLENKNYKNLTINEAVDSVVDDLTKENYLTSSDTYILISARNDDRERAIEITERVSNEVALSSIRNNVSPNIYTQKLYDDKGTKDNANRYGVSQGKMQLVQTILEQAPFFSISDLTKLSIGQLSKLASDNGIHTYLDEKDYSKPASSKKDSTDDKSSLEDKDEQEKSASESSIEDKTSESIVSQPASSSTPSSKYDEPVSAKVENAPIEPSSSPEKVEKEPSSTLETSLSESSTESSNESSTSFVDTRSGATTYSGATKNRNNYDTKSGATR